MERRDFIQKTALGTGIACLSPWSVIAGITGEKHHELQKHKITKIEKVKFEFHWPRHVGKNARLGNHGQYHTGVAFKIYTLKKPIIDKII